MVNETFTATCNTCCKPATMPWRVRGENGDFVLGCIDSFHDGIHADSWHLRKEAVAYRKATAKRLAEMLA